MRHNKDLIIGLNDNNYLLPDFKTADFKTSEILSFYLLINIATMTGVQPK